ncbi:hypothetical protein K438DRAFT_1605077, partial [Mycena galopus ATCC 62051]
MAYLCASQEVIAKDAKASLLFSQFRGEVEVEEGSKVCLFSKTGPLGKPKKNSNRAKKKKKKGKKQKPCPSASVNLHEAETPSASTADTKLDTDRVPSVPETPRHAACLPEEPQADIVSTLLGKKYKPVADKIKPILGELPAKFRIERDIKGDPLKEMPTLDMHPPDYVPLGRYTAERQEVVNQ